MIQVRNTKDISDALASDPGLEDSMKTDPIETIRKNFKVVPDTKVYRYVVIFLGMTVLLVIIGYFTIPLTGLKELEPAIIALASAAIGALAGLLAPQPG